MLFTIVVIDAAVDLTCADKAPAPSTWSTRVSMNLIRGSKKGLSRASTAVTSGRSKSSTSVYVSIAIKEDRHMSIPWTRVPTVITTTSTMSFTNASMTVRSATSAATSPRASPNTVPVIAGTRVVIATSRAPTTPIRFWATEGTITPVTSTATVDTTFVSQILNLNARFLLHTNGVQIFCHRWFKIGHNSMDRVEESIASSHSAHTWCGKCWGDIAESSKNGDNLETHFEFQKDKDLKRNRIEFNWFKRVTVDGWRESRSSRGSPLLIWIQIIIQRSSTDLSDELFITTGQATYVPRSHCREEIARNSCRVLTYVTYSKRARTRRSQSWSLNNHRINQLS